MRRLFSFSLIFILFFVANAQFLFAQEGGQYIHKHLTRATLTFATGFMPQHGDQPIYLDGNLEYYTGNRISVLGETYVFVGTLNDKDAARPFPVANHQTFFGPVYHFSTGGHLDPYVGFQPGLALSQTEIGVLGYSGKMTANPLASLNVGMNYYARKYFHFFVNARYVEGMHLSDAPEPLSLRELRFSFGLGFNLF